MSDTAVRNANLDDLVAILNSQHARKIDLVAPANLLRAEAGQIQVSGADWAVDEDGVTDPNGTYLPTQVADAGSCSAAS